MTRDGHFSQLERHVSGVPDHLAADRDQLAPQRRQCPVKLQPHLIGAVAANESICFNIHMSFGDYHLRK